MLFVSFVIVRCYLLSIIWMVVQCVWVFINCWYLCFALFWRNVVFDCVMILVIVISCYFFVFWLIGWFCGLVVLVFVCLLGCFGLLLVWFVCLFINDGCLHIVVDVCFRLLLFVISFRLFALYGFVVYCDSCLVVVWFDSCELGGLFCLMFAFVCLMRVFFVLCFSCVYVLIMICFVCCCV